MNGQTWHDCHTQSSLMTLKTLWADAEADHRESLIIARCGVCGQLWKVRRQWDAGTGRDDIWLRPGESERGYEFTMEEAAEFGEEAKASE